MEPLNYNDQRELPPPKQQIARLERLFDETCERAEYWEADDRPQL
jgi:hypothetical protein